mmetsp:Transcript_132236/g.254595  ORF Transcript_132236/g.254595 Transcript_132236/m.254595 type:complete len:210 (+) Transcript_132236:1066-1695(+)
MAARKVVAAMVLPLRNLQLSLGQLMMPQWQELQQLLERPQLTRQQLPPRAPWLGWPLQLHRRAPAASAGGNHPCCHASAQRPAGALQLPPSVAFALFLFQLAQLLLHRRKMPAKQLPMRQLLLHLPLAAHLCHLLRSPSRMMMGWQLLTRPRLRDRGSLPPPAAPPQTMLAVSPLYLILYHQACPAPGFEDLPHPGLLHPFSPRPASSC